MGCFRHANPNLRQQKISLVIAWIFVRRSPDDICPGRGGFSYDDVNFVNPFHESDCVRSTRSRFVWLCQKKKIVVGLRMIFFRNTDANSRFTMMTIMKCPSIDPNSFLASSCSLFLLVDPSEFPCNSSLRSSPNKIILPQNWLSKFILFQTTLPCRLRFGTWNFHHFGRFTSYALTLQLGFLKRPIS